MTSNLQRTINGYISAGLIAAYSLAPSIGYATTSNTNTSNPQRIIRGVPQSPIRDGNYEQVHHGRARGLGWTQEDTTYTLVKNAHVEFDSNGHPKLITAPRDKNVNGNHANVYIMHIDRKNGFGLWSQEKSDQYVVRNGRVTYFIDQNGNVVHTQRSIIDAPIVAETVAPESLELRIRRAEALGDSSRIDRIATHAAERLYHSHANKNAGTERVNKRVSTPRPQTESPTTQTTNYDARATADSLVRAYHLRSQARADSIRAVAYKDSLERLVHEKSYADSVVVAEQARADSLKRINQRLSTNFDKCHKQKHNHTTAAIVLGSVLAGIGGYLIWDNNHGHHSNDGLEGGQTYGDGVK
jgi:hypothetical protein